MISAELLRMLRSNLDNAPQDIKNAYNTFIIKLFNDNPYALSRNLVTGKLYLMPSSLYLKVHSIMWIGKLEELEKYDGKDTNLV